MRNTKTTLAGIGLIMAKDASEKLEIKKPE